jgi:hypothetical protein
MAEATEKNSKAKATAPPTPKAAPSGPPAQAPRGHSGGWKQDFVDGLVADPGNWQVLNDVSPSVVSHLKKIEVDGGELEVASRNSHFIEGRKTRVADVYARFIKTSK